MVRGGGFWLLTTCYKYMSIVVQKYGGSSVADTYRILGVAERIVKRRQQGDDLVVVVSAMANTTDSLIQLARQIDGHPPEREYDMLLTAGERISMALLSMAIQKLGKRAVSFTGSQSGIITDGDHTRARIIEVRPTRIIETLNAGDIAIVAGFQGVSGKRDITTLGRGGSDTTAVALGAALGAEICEIYTDVEGIFSADPNRIPNTELLPEITFEQTLDLAYFGAKVLHSRAVELARSASLPLRVASSITERKGTSIVEKIIGMEQPRFVAISKRDDICLCSIEVADVKDNSDIFSKLDKERVQIGFPRTQTTPAGWETTFWVPKTDAERVRSILTEANLQLNCDVCLLALVGHEIAQRAVVIREVMEFLLEQKAELLLVNTTQVSVMIVVPSGCGAKLEEALHNKFVKGSSFEVY